MGFKKGSSRVLQGLIQVGIEGFMSVFRRPLSRVLDRFYMVSCSAARTFYGFRWRSMMVVVRSTCLPNGRTFGSRFGWDLLIGPEPETQELRITQVSSCQFTGGRKPGKESLGAS